MQGIKEAELDRLAHPVDLSQSHHKRVMAASLLLLN